MLRFFLSATGWILYFALIVFFGCLPVLYLFGGLKTGNPEWRKWYPTWALWLVGKNEFKN